MKPLGTEFRKSSYSLNGNCIEVAAPGRVKVRDSKDTAIPGFSVSPGAWSAFTSAAAGGDLTWK